MRLDCYGFNCDSLKAIEFLFPRQQTSVTHNYSICDAAQGAEVRAGPTRVTGSSAIISLNCVINADVIDLNNRCVRTSCSRPSLTP